MKNSLSILFQKTKEMIPMLDRVKVTSNEIAEVKYGFGDVFKQHESGERVVIAFIKKENIISLVSEDILFEGEPVRYEISEKQLLDNYFLFETTRPLTSNKNFTTSF